MSVVYRKICRAIFTGGIVTKCFDVVSLFFDIHA